MLAHSAKQITWLTTNFNFIGMHATENIGIKLSTDREDIIYYFTPKAGNL